MNILLGVTGGIAAYKSLELVRLFVKAGHDVQVVMTSGAKEFIQPLSFQALSGHPVRDSLFDANQEAGMGHIELARWPDVIVIAPASAETLAKLRMGRADDLLTTLCLATDRPILLAPAMNRLMWQNAATQENLEMLANRGFEIMKPGSGEQACGEVGEGRLPEPADIFSATESLVASLQPDPAWQILPEFWKGKHLLITAGPTFEDIDPVRFIGNKSSGKMGYAIAEAAAQAGAEVTLITGPVALKVSETIRKVSVRSAQQMFESVQENYASCDVFISAAAVADYRISKPKLQKIKKTDGQDDLTLNLVKNPDIVKWVAEQTPKPYVVGFAAETEKLETYAQDKLKRKNLDMICANSVSGGKGFEQDDNALLLLTESRQKNLLRAPKTRLAKSLLVFIAESISETE
ncbi:bifunctional phosphopantothenoylcysteine decarboxylase/phosphopantothenate--cysteine ligase CoaBC [Hydrogenovibrio kuenenii]|uniref:bifunctional phosphopantothenoylcysteine decarboxylase/phosphopantothenate--cysteine ligase CoaBC n=1 Tax=Hydrogenovibrio kuenenii TaxID=63658 RepID=UPI0004649E03|nr:bifunctional phosphopantothenoylcysteine decarboxylase/phosphopantothenate--cysteine ligase CoaBC [Hydrogenovibrio kuenenii]